MRGIVRTVLTRVAKSGLPGEHHFYIAFRTDAPGVSISKRLKEKYPEEMTIVLQHRFWDLAVKEDHFEVKLTFDSIPERLSVPFEAIKVFFDPSVPYGLQFEDFDIAGAAAQELVGPQRESGSPKSHRPSAPTEHTMPLQGAPTRSRARRAGLSRRRRQSAPPQPAPTKHRASPCLPWSSPPSRARRRAPRWSASMPSATRSDGGAFR